MAVLSELTTQIELEMTGDTRRYLVSAKQGDKATRFIIAKLRNNGEEYTIPTGARAIANIEKPDGKHIYNTCTYSGSEVTVELTNQALAAAGTAYCDIEIRTSDNAQIITSVSFTIEVERTMRNDNAILSSNEFTELEDRIAGHIQNIDDTEEAVRLAESARVTAENARVEAESARASAEQTRQQNESTRVQQETARQQDTAQAVADAESATEAAVIATEGCEIVTQKAEEALQNQEQLEATLRAVTQMQQAVAQMEQTVEAAKAQVEQYKEEIDTVLRTLQEPDSTLSESSTNTVQNKVVTQELNTKANQTELDTHTSNGTIHITAAERTAWNNKVDKVSGKALSTNDFTDAYKSKLDGIATGATKVTVDSALSSSSTNPVRNSVVYNALSNKSDTSHTHSVATTSAAGFMSAYDKSKLNTITEYANRVTVYSNSSESMSLPSKTFVTPLSLTLSSGTYLIIAFADLTTSMSDIYALDISGTNNSRNAVRQSGNAGGGITTCVVDSFRYSTTVYLRLYSTSATANTARGWLYAIKLY